MYTQVVRRFGKSHVVIENSDDLTFELTIDFSICKVRGRSPDLVVPGDLDGDGDVDFVLLYQGSTQQVLLRE